MISLGIDIGSVSVKLATVDNGNIVNTIYRRFHGKPFETLHDILSNEFSDLNGTEIRLGLTGIGGKSLSSILGGRFYGEIAAIATGNYLIAPSVKTVIEMGGEDSKLLILNQDKKMVTDFAMNAQCAAGTGSFLDQQANRLKISIENEFGQLALRSKKPPRIAGRCSVFAKSDMIHLQQIGTPDYDIVAGLCYAVARNFKSSIARGKKIEKPVAFEGGVASNPGMIRAFADILGIDKEELIIPDHYNVVGAIGAALLSNSDSSLKLRVEKIKEYLEYKKIVESDRDSLSYDYPESKYYDITLKKSSDQIENIEVCLGIDVGSLSTNLVLIDDENNIIARRYLMTEGRPIEAVRRGLKEFEAEVGQKVIVKAVGSTGSGRYLTGELIGADVIRNEITAQATAAIAIDPEVDTIFEIGGQDSKYISIDNKAVIDFEMNKACAAGTGSFLQEQAEKLNINIETEFADKALCSSCPVGCGERCTVFMESDLVSHQRKGAQKDDILAGLAYSIAGNYLTRVVGDRRVGNHIFFQGGVAWNKAVVAAFEKLIGKSITVPPHHDVTGAIGAALLSREKLADPDFKTKFKGFDFYKRRYDLDSFVCEDCSNQCEIHSVNIENEKPLYYGSRCEKYEVETKDEIKLTEDYFTLRQKHLLKRYVEPSETKKNKSVGLPRVLHFYEYYPFWKGFFESLGYDVINSDKSNQLIVENALELFTAETCYPIKIVYGHIANLISKKPDIIFLPSLIKVAEEDDSNKTGAFICPYVQTIGSALKTKFDFESNGIEFINSSMSLNQDIVDLKQYMRQLANDLNLSDSELNIGLTAGLQAFKQFKLILKEEGKKILDDIDTDEKILIIISRPYSSFDRKLSLELPDKIRRLGVKAIPLDFLPIGDGNGDYPFMYWRYGKKILASAEYIRKHPNFYAVYISSFGCGPDSFITHFFRKAMSDKPYLQLELDEHSADAGLITRVEAFMDSLRFYKYKPPISTFTIASKEFKPFEKTIYIPNMCDHAYPLRAAFEKYGLKAEVLDEPDNTTLDIGKKFTSGKECFPCILTTGDMIKKINSEKFDRDKTIFFMPGAGGPCRFGLYSQFHRMILADLGYRDIPILSPNSENGYSNFGLDKTDFRKTAWQGLLFVDCLIKLLHSIKPYEKNIGDTEKVYYHYLRRLEYVIINRLSIKKLSQEAAEGFSKVEIHSEKKPIVGVVGEIYLRNNRYSNNYLIDNLEKLGMEVWLAPFAEWLLYTSTTYQRDSIQDRNIKGFIESTSQLLIQQWHEKRILKAFGKKHHIRHDYPISKVLDYASKYLPIDYKGEAVLSVGKSIEMVKEGASGIINAMPFNCMPGTVVSSLSKKISDDLGGVPWLNISYEGLRDSGEETRLEAFAEQVKANSINLKEYTEF